MFFATEYVCSMRNFMFANISKCTNNNVDQINLKDIFYGIYILLNKDYVEKDKFNLHELLIKILEISDTKKLFENNFENIIIFKHIIVYLSRLTTYYWKNTITEITQKENISKELLSVLKTCKFNLMCIIYKLYVLRDELMLYVYQQNISYCEQIKDVGYDTFDDEIEHVIFRTFLYHTIISK